MLNAKFCFSWHQRRYLRRRAKPVGWYESAPERLSKIVPHGNFRLYTSAGLLMVRSARAGCKRAGEKKWKYATSVMCSRPCCLFKGKLDRDPPKDRSLAPFCLITMFLKLTTLPSPWSQESRPQEHSTYWEQHQNPKGEHICYLSAVSNNSKKLRHDIQILTLTTVPKFGLMTRR